MSKHRLIIGAALAAASLVVGACGSDDDGGGDGGGGQTTVAATKGGVMLGPNGEKATPADEITLSAEDEQKLRDGGHTAAIVWHNASEDFSKGVQRGIEARFDELGIELVATTDAAFDAAKQQRDVESVLARNPDAIVSIPVDPVSAAKAFKPAVSRGVALTFLSNIPQGYKHGRDYVGVVTSDQITTGENTARLLGEALGGEGKIGYIYYDADFFITQQRDGAFREALAENYPNIEVAAESGFEDPARVEEVAAAMLTRNPDLDGLYVTWAQPAEGALSALRDAGRDDMKVVTVDLSEPVAVDLASGGSIVGVSTDRAYELGRKLADVAGLGILGKEAPAFSTIPTIAVDQENVVEAWDESYGEPAPKEVVDAAGG